MGADGAALSGAVGAGATVAADDAAEDAFGAAVVADAADDDAALDGVDADVDAVAAGAADDAAEGAFWASADDVESTTDEDDDEADDFFFPFDFAPGAAFRTSPCQRDSAIRRSSAVGRFPAHVGGTTTSPSSRCLSCNEICRRKARWSSLSAIV